MGLQLGPGGGEGGLKLVVEGRIISERLRYGLCELQCPIIFPG